MLVSFSVSNYKSFDKEQTFDMAASKITKHNDHVAVVNKKRILKSALIFGANAGGKTNLIRAIEFSSRIIRNGMKSVPLSKQYFRINVDNYQKPGVFKYHIMVDHNEYIYELSISYSKQIILAEKLIKLTRAKKEILLYNRYLDSDGNPIVEKPQIKLSKEEETRLNVYLNDFEGSISADLQKKTILSDLASRSNVQESIFQELSNVFDWFDRLIILFPESIFTGLNEMGKQDDKLAFFKSFMVYLDTGIQNIESEEKHFDINELLGNIPANIAEEMKADIAEKLQENPVTLRLGGEDALLLHKDSEGNIVYDQLQFDHGNPKDLFEYADESDGTKRLFDLAPLFFDITKHPIIIIDEIDRSLHTSVVRSYLEFFFEINKNRDAQLIATSHDTNLMDLEIMRQDEIWLIDRNEKNCSTINSLRNFNVRFDKRVAPDYLTNHYGGVPKTTKENRIRLVKQTEEVIKEVE